MRESIQSLEDLQILEESIDIECKLAGGKDGQGAVPKDFWPTYSSFANSQGGRIFLGLKERKGQFELVGIEKAQDLSLSLLSTLNNANKVSKNLLTDKDIQISEIAGKKIICVNVPQALRIDKPVYIDGNPLKGTYRRYNSGDMRCSEEEVKRMLAEQVEDSRDNKLLKGYDCNDIDMQSFREYRIMFSNRQADHPWASQEDQTFMRSIGAWTKDRQTGEEGLTLAGLLMFGQGAAIEECLPYYLLDYQERPEAKTELRWVDRLTIDGTWSGNLFDFYRKVINKLTGDLKIPFKLKADQRQAETIVHTALREALINCLVHADYSERSSVLVVKRPDMFGFRNPGSMRIPIDTAISGGLSDCRNRLLHKMFLLIGLGERAGSGIPKIFSGWKSQSWTQPEILEVAEPAQTLVKMRMVDLLDPKASVFLKEHFGPAYESLSAEEAHILSAVFFEESINHCRLKELTAISSSKLSEFLNQLLKSKFLEASGTGRAKHYHLFGLAKPSAEDDEFRSLKEPQFLQAPVISGQAPVISGQAPVISYQAPVIDNVGENWQELMTLAQEVREKGRVKSEDFRKVIKKLCHGHYVRTRQLKELLGREENYLRRHHLSPMVQTGELEMAYPATPNHPDQGYRTTVQEDKS